MRMPFVFAVVASIMPLLAWAGPVNINTADAATLAKELKGIGAARAQAIVAYRSQHGPFKSADELALVKGIAQKVIDENRDNIRLDGRAEGRSDAARAAQVPAKPAKAPGGP